jgi:hypothetical protein
VKGVGFLLGAALLAAFGFENSVLGMAAVLTVILLAVAALMPAGLPRGARARSSARCSRRTANVNWLSRRRVFLFGARDVWFVVGIPIYFYAVLSDGTPEGNRAAFFMIGSSWRSGSSFTARCRPAPPGFCAPPPAPRPR